MSDYQFDWAKVPEVSIDELMRQAEACLTGTVTLAIAADQRATTLSGIFGGSAVALLAAAATIVSATKPDTGLLVGAIAIAVPLFTASCLAALAGRPTDFFVGGYEPKKLILSATEHLWLLRYTISDLQMRIDANRRVLERSARLIKWSFYTAAFAVAAGILAFTAFHVLPDPRPS